LPQAPLSQQPLEHWSQQAHTQLVLVWAARLVVSAIVDSAKAIMQNTSCNFDFMFVSSEFPVGAKTQLRRSHRAAARGRRKQAMSVRSRS
jgi:hypothetical protein